MHCFIAVRPSSRRIARLVMAIALGFSSLSCVSYLKAQGPPQSPPQQARRILEPQWTELWTTGGQATDTLFGQPAVLTANRERVYVWDPQRRAVLAFRARDGLLEWMVGGRGRIANVVDPQWVALDKRGNLYVPDVGRLAIHVISGNGVPVRVIQAQQYGHVMSICVLGDGTVLASTPEPSRPVVHMDSAGLPLGPVKLPWPDAATIHAEGSGRVSSLGQRAGCVYTLGSGSGFARWVNSSFSSLREYIERGPPPPGRGSGYAVSGDSSTIAIAFDGATAHRTKILDVYATRTGRYLHSLLLPVGVYGIARVGDVYYVTSAMKGRPFLRALRMSTRKR